MAIKDSVLNIVIKAQNLASDVIAKFRKDVETLDSTSAEASKSVDSLGTAADNLGKDASSASTGTNTLNSALDDVSENASDAAESLERADDSMEDIASAAKSVNDSTASASKSLNDLGDAAQELGTNTQSAGAGTESLVDAVSEIDSKTTAATDAVDELGDAAADLGKEASGASAGTSKLNSALDGVSSNANDAADSLEHADDSVDAMAASANASAAAADKAGTAATKLAQRYDAAGKPIETARQEINKTNSELKEVDGATNKAGTSIGSLTKRLLGLVTAVVGIRTITSALKSMFETGDKFERLSLQMEQTMGSLAAGEQATEWVKDFAKNTPLQLGEVTDTFLRLKNFGLDPQAGAMQAIVDQAAKLGKGYEAVEGISLALGQAWAKQKLQGEEILQLIERGVPVWDLLAKTTGKTTAEIQKMSEAGLLGRDAIKAMIDEMGKQSAGAAAQNMSLLSGYISTLKDEWQLFLNEIAKSGALDYAKDQLRQLIQYIQELKTNGELQEWAKKISDGFISVAEASKTVVVAIKEHTDSVKALAAAWVGFKVTSVVAELGLLATALKVKVAEGAAKAATAAINLSAALRALPWVAVGAEVVHAATAFLRMKDAQLEAGKAVLNTIPPLLESIDTLQKFNEQTGLNVQSLDEIIAMQDAGAVAIDDYTGKWRLATDQITEAEKAERANTKAMQEAQQERIKQMQQVDPIIDSLVAKFNEASEKGDDLNVTIAALGEEAIKSGEVGMQALTAALQGLAINGKLTAGQLEGGLAKLLLSLSEEQFQKFGPGIVAALNSIKEGSVSTTAALTGLKTTIGDELSAAAEKLGIDLGEIFTGIDKETQSTIFNIQTLGEKFKAAGKSAEEAGTAIKAGLIENLDELDSTQEIDAMIAALKSMAAAGLITDAALKEMLATLEKQRQVILGAANSQGSLSDANKEAAATWAMVGSAAEDAAAGMEVAGGATKWLQDAYAELRAEVDALGPAATAAFDKLQGFRPDTTPIVGDFSELKQTIADTGEEIDRLKKTATFTDFTGINTFLRDSAINAAIVKKEYAEQKLAVEQLQAAYANGSISAQQFINSTRGAANSTSLLNQQDLSALRSQIDAAKQRMESFKQSTSSALNSLRSELAQLQGNAERVERLAYESRVADLERQLEEAKKTGDREAIANAQESLRVAKEIYQIKQQQLAEEKREAARQKAEAEAAAQKEEQRQAQTQQQTPVTPSQQQPQSNTGPVQRIEVALPNGRSATLSGSVDDVNNFLDFLTQAGLRSL